MSDHDTQETVSKPKETVHEVKIRHQTEIKNVVKPLKGKAKKEKEKELLEIHSLELEQVQKLWELYRKAEAGIDETEMSIDSTPSSTTTTTTAAAHAKSVKKRIQREERAAREELELLEIEKKKNLPTKGTDESAILKRQLQKIHFTAPFEDSEGGEIYDIAADGNCLFRAIAHQLQFYHPYENVLDVIPDYMILRKQCEEELLQHIDEYSPYLTNDNGELLSHEEIKEYAHGIGSSTSDALWGSHTEVSILSKLYKRPIAIVNSEFILTIGGEDGDDEDGREECVVEGQIEEKQKQKYTKLYISYHQHLISTGEHYNSIIPK